MGFGEKAGITKLSELEIDADKDWQGRGIRRLKELALGMSKGDIVYCGPGGVLVKVSPGSIGHELTSHGPGHAIEWNAPPGG